MAHPPCGAETDLLARTARRRAVAAARQGSTWSARAGDRALNVQLGRYRTAPTLQISVGAACCPTHAVEVDELLRHAISRTTPTVGGTIL